ncbi:MAG: hypothetical protein ACJAYU_000603 [Bradymonadia bacterium]|jgi:hypothetical protein
MSRTICFLIAASSLGTALAGCTADVESDVDSMCAAISAVMGTPEFAAADEQARQPLVINAMAEAMSTSELGSFIGDLAETPRPDRSAAAEAFASTYGFEWDCAAFDQAFIAEPSAPDAVVEEVPAVVDSALRANEGQAADASGSGGAAPADGPSVAEPVAAEPAAEPASQPSEAD